MSAPLHIIFQDSAIIVVNKASGVLTHNSAFAGPKEESLIQLLGGKLHAIHRLDRATSGVVVFARSPEAAAQWQAALAQPTTRKRYLALVRGKLEGTQELDHAIRDEDGTLREARSTIRGVALSTVDRCSLVEVELHTGRHHQARRHLKHLSHPVLGDTTYGHGKDNLHFRERFELHRLALHARALTITRPDNAAEQTFMALLPDDLERVITRLFPGVTVP